MKTNTTIPKYGRYKKPTARLTVRHLYQRDTKVMKNSDRKDARLPLQYSHLEYGCKCAGEVRSSRVSYHSTGAFYGPTFFW